MGPAVDAPEYHDCVDIDMFVVAPARRGTGVARTSFLLAPEVGVLAFAVRESFLSTANSAVRNASAALDYVGLGCSLTRVTSAPGLAQFDPDPEAPYSAARLIASVRMANLRLHANESFVATEVATSIAALYVGASPAVLVTCGPYVDAWIVRRGALVPLVTARRTPVWPMDDPAALLEEARAFEALEWVGRREHVTPRAMDVSLEPGDIVGLGTPERSLVDLLVGGASIDGVLAQFAGSWGPLCVLGRVGR